MANLDYITQVPPPVLIDEWQLAPPVWDRVRRAVDEDSTGGRFLLACSAGVAPGVRIDSGAGRIISIPLRPLSFSERDLVVEGDDRRVVAIEVKLAATVNDHDVRHLNWLQEKIGDQLSDRVVITSGEYAYRRPDGVAVIPFALLGP